MRPSYWLHYASSPSVCPVRARNSKTKKNRKITIGINVSQGTSKWSANFQLKKGREVKVTGRQKPQEIAAYLAYRIRVYIRAADQTPTAQAPTAKQA